MDDVFADGLGIFDVTDRIEDHARGVKAHKSTCYGRKELDWRLNGFGGCRFVERYGEYGNDCNQHLANSWDTWHKYQYWCVHCRSKVGYTWKQGIEVRKISRGRRVAQQAEEEDEDKW